MIKTRPRRSEVPSAFQWELSKLYSTIEEWEKDFNKLSFLLKKIIIYKGKVMINSHNLLMILKKDEEITRLLNNLYVYAYMKYHEDTLNEQYIILKGKIDKLYNDTNEQKIFISNEILENKYSLVEEYIKQERKLKQYELKLDMMFKQKPYLLTSKEEQIIASMGEILTSSSNIYNVIYNTDIKYGTIKVDNNEIEITASNYIKLLNHNNPQIRAEVFNKVYKTYDNLKNTFSTILKYNIKTITLISNLKKYDSPLQMCLFNNYINPIIYYNLLDVVNSKLNILHKYVSLRKKELNIDKLHMYDMYIDIAKDVNKEYSYDDAMQIIKKALKPLGKDYIDIIDKAYYEKWIDVFDNENKKSGAYSWGTYDSNPYILLNYNGMLNDIFILAHELGHSIHTYYTNKNQTYTYSNYTIFLAEIASSVNEILLCKYLLDIATNNNEKKLILNQMMEKFKGSLYRQTMFAEFEKIIYEKEQNDEILTEKLISNTYYDLNKKYYGSDVIHDREIALEWIRINHFYKPFYVYQYATGISIAFIIAYAIYDGDEKMLSNYKQFLSSGSSDYPLNLLKQLGIDILDKTIIEKAINIFSDIIDQYIELE